MNEALRARLAEIDAQPAENLTGELRPALPLRKLWTTEPPKTSTII